MGLINRIALTFFFVVCLLLPVTCFGVTNPCPPFYLQTDSGQTINPITGENADQPYSTRQTCGTCHDVDKISNGYHFVMDWDQADDGRFEDTQMPWRVSNGLTGNLITYGFYQLAKKENTHADEIDLSVFEFVARVPEAFNGYQKPGCAACHPGGGMMEFDRDGFRYDRRLSQNPGLATTLDGDYYASQWDKTGVIEPDCFFCHASRYHIQARIQQIKNLNFKWAGVAASGIGQVYGKVSDGQIPRVVYNKRLFNEDGTFYLPDMVFEPTAENCLICHATIELGKRGNSWDDPINPDVHHLAGLTCIDCHFGDIRHNFAKGNAMGSTVADHLDNTMRSCRDCHTQGYKGATRMTHQAIRKDHLDKLSCEACHIPELNRSAVGAMYLNTGTFGKQGQIGTQRFGESKPWKPAYVIRKKDKDQKSRITPVNPMVNSLFTNVDADGKYYPLFLSEVATAYDLCKDQMTPRQVPYDFHDPENIRLMLETLGRCLGENKRFTSIAPNFHTAGTLYSLTSRLSLVSEPDTTWVSQIPYFSISHNVSPADKALGAKGCTDCHAEDSHLFSGLVVRDYFSNAGSPLTVSMDRFLDLPSSVQKWNTGFAVYLKMARPLFLAGIVMGVLILAFTLFPHRQALSNFSGLWAIVQSMILVLMLCAGHLLLVRDMGVFLSLWETLMNASSLLGGILMGGAVVSYFYLIQHRVQNRPLLRGGQLLGLLTIITGFMVWLHPFAGMDFALFISGIHGVLAMVMAVGLLFFSLIKRPKKSER